MRPKYLKQLWKTSCCFANCIAHVVLVDLTTKSRVDSSERRLRGLLVGWYNNRSPSVVNTQCKTNLAKEILGYCPTTLVQRLRNVKTLTAMAENNRAFAHFQLVNRQSLGTAGCKVKIGSDAVFDRIGGFIFTQHPNSRSNRLTDF